MASQGLAMDLVSLQPKSWQQTVVLVALLPMTALRRRLSQELTRRLVWTLPLPLPPWI